MFSFLQFVYLSTFFQHYVSFYFCFLNFSSVVLAILIVSFSFPTPITQGQCLEHFFTHELRVVPFRYYLCVYFVDHVVVTCWLCSLLFIALVSVVLMVLSSCLPESLLPPTLNAIIFLKGLRSMIPSLSLHKPLLSFPSLIVSLLQTNSGLGIDTF